MRRSGHARPSGTTVTCIRQGDRHCRQIPGDIAATFKRRGTEIPTEPPDALSPGFAADVQKQQQWNAFLQNVATNPGSLADVIEMIAGFILPQAAQALRLD
jgi:hypothetical protein